MDCKNYLKIIILFGSALLIFSHSQLLAGEFYVIKVYDGDTIEVDKKGKKLTIRLVGIDAPEEGQPFCDKARKLLTSLCLKTTANVKSYGTDRYGRTLGVVILYAVTDAGLEMIKAGFAEAYRGKPPDGFDIKPYIKAETQARKNRLGMWRQGEKYISPMVWRKGRKY
jgi:endonuclease YncB( thermonuclease family)